MVICTRFLKDTFLNYQSKTKAMTTAKIFVYKTKDNLHIPINNFDLAKPIPKVLEYFIKGKGWQKTKHFSRIEVEIPVSKDSLKDIAETGALYGKEVCMNHLITDNAESWKEQRYAEAMWVYSALNERKLWDVAVKCGILEIIVMDWMLWGLLDIVETDKKLSELHDEYSDVSCTLNGKTASCEAAIRHFYGEDGVNILNYLLDTSINNFYE